MSILRTHDKMAPTQKNTQNNTKTRKTPRRNRLSEQSIFCVFRIFIFYVMLYL